MSTHNNDTADPLAVGLTRPAMRWGVTYAALIVNGACTMEVFLITQNLLSLSLALPIHGICVLMCSREPRCFDLLALWCRYRVPAFARNYFFWRASSYSPLSIDLPGRNGQRVRLPEVLT